MFIRVKKRNSKNGTKRYAYLVKNSWDSGSKQKVVKYLGRVRKFDGETKSDITNLNLDSHWRDVVDQLIKDLLSNLGFKIIDEQYILDNVKVDPRSDKVLINDKDGVIEVNEGFLCNHTIVSLKRLKSQNAKEFASILLSSGILPTKELFVGLYQKSKRLKRSKDNN